ncbi:Cell cycle serine/threonine-protein kinase cdc5/MSD2 [Rhizophlyctis rosea]|nr:Cell cycle serine/threonine-protein kinase cdc5/MSD2 [Rhizophlyctis rosea]
MQERKPSGGGGNGGAAGGGDDRHIPPAPPSVAAHKSCPSPPPVLYDRRAHSEYQRGRLLGEGGFAKCYEVVTPTTDRLAAKVVPKASLKSTKQKNKLIAEIKIHQVMSHPHIVTFHHFFEDDDNVYMILELCENRTFVDMLKKRRRLTELEVRYYMWQLLNALRYMHGRNIIHRDVKLGNLFLDKDMNMKLGDFGLAAMIKQDGERKRTICGTPNYIAPEVLFGQEKGHSFEADIWSAGVVMYTMLIGKPPFQTKDVKSIYKRIGEGRFEFPSTVTISDSARSIITSILHNSPECRPSITKIMQHEFFTAEPRPVCIPVSALETVPQLEVPPLKRNGSSGRSASRSPLKRVQERDGGGDGGGVGELVGRFAGVGLESPAKASPGKAGAGVGVGVNGDRSRASPNGVRENGKRRTERNEPDAEQEVENRYPMMPGGWREARSANPQPTTSSTKIPAEYGLPTPTTDSDNSNEKEPPVVEVPMMRPKAIKVGRGPSPDEASPVSPGGWRSVGGGSPVTLGKSGEVLGSPRRTTTVLEAMHRNLSLALASVGEEGAGSGKGSPGMRPVPVPTTVTFPDVFITKWIDYSNKYGLGYQLRDGSVGVYFNDSTSIILAADNMHFEYLYYEKGNERTSMHRKPHTLQSYPEELNKKVTLLKHFRGYMQNNLFRVVGQEPGVEPKIREMDFLTKYLRTKHGVIFRLSNHVMQLNLFDHTKLILSSDALVVTYADKNRELVTRTLGDAVEVGGKQVVDRLKYAKDVLWQMILKKQRREGAGGGGGRVGGRRWGGGGDGAGEE